MILTEKGATPPLTPLANLQLQVLLTTSNSHRTAPVAFSSTAIIAGRLRRGRAEELHNRAVATQQERHASWGERHPSGGRRRVVIHVVAVALHIDVRLRKRGRVAFRLHNIVLEVVEGVYGRRVASKERGQALRAARATRTASIINAVEQGYGRGRTRTAYHDSAAIKAIFTVYGDDELDARGAVLFSEREDELKVVEKPT